MDKRFEKIKAIFFDLDDTIVSFYSSTVKAWDKVCRDYTASNPCTFSAEKMIETITQVRRTYWSDPTRHKRGRENIKQARRELLLMAMPLLGVNDSDIAIQVADAYTIAQDEMLTLFDGAYEAIEQIRCAGYKTALITNGSAEGQRRKLTRFKLTPLFDEIVIDTEVGFSKPDKRIFQVCLDRLGVLPEEALMIGDKPEWDVISPHEMGIFAVWNNYRCSDGNVPEKADLTVKSVAELASILPGRNTTK